MKKGFTLIELLAVIVVIAIIGSISGMAITKIIDKSKSNTLISSANMLAKAARLNYASLQNEQEIPNVLFTFANGIQTSNVDNRKLEFDGFGPKNGKLFLDNKGKINLAIHDGKHCAYKEGEIIKTVILSQEECLAKVSFIASKLLENGDVKYINNPSATGYPVNASPCKYYGLNFTHVLDKRDNKVYALSLINNQCWFADNLAYAPEACLNASWDNNAWNSGIPNDACRLNGGSTWDKEEVLYQWDAAMAGSITENSQGLCPAGFHIPSDREWKNLEIYMGMDEVQTDLTAQWRGTDQGAQLKTLFLSINGTDLFGFNAKLAGSSGASYLVYNKGSQGDWWTSTPSSYYSGKPYRSYFRSLDKSNATIYRHEYLLVYGRSVRCLLNN